MRGRERRRLHRYHARPDRRRSAQEPHDRGRLQERDRHHYQWHGDQLRQNHHAGVRLLGHIALRWAACGGCRGEWRSDGDVQLYHHRQHGSQTSTVTLTEYNDTAHPQALGFVFTVDTTKPGTSNKYDHASCQYWDHRDEHYAVFGAMAPHAYTGSSTPTTPMRRRFAPSPLLASSRALPSTMAATAKLTNISQLATLPQKTDGAFYGCKSLTTTQPTRPSQRLHERALHVRG